MTVTPAAVRKQQQVERDRKKFAKLGGRHIRFAAYGATCDALEELCKHYGFTGKQRIAECITHMIHEKHDIVTTHKTEETTK